MAIGISLRKANDHFNETVSLFISHCTVLKSAMARNSIPIYELLYGTKICNYCYKIAMEIEVYMLRKWQEYVSKIGHGCMCVSVLCVYIICECGCCGGVAVGPILCSTGCNTQKSFFFPFTASYSSIKNWPLKKSSHSYILDIL